MIFFQKLQRRQQFFISIIMQITISSYIVKKSSTGEG